MRRIFISLILFTACNSKKLPSDVIEPERMKLIVWDVLRADEYAADQFHSDSSKSMRKHLSADYANVFAVHKINSNTFYNSYKYYRAHPFLHKILMDSVYAYGTRQRAKLDIQTPKPGQGPKPGFE